MSAIDHSPLPYHVETHGTTPGNTTIELADKHGIAVAVLCLRSNPDEHKANAAFLARACNAHDPLVAAAEMAQCDCNPKERESGHKWGCWFPDLREALDNVKAQEQEQAAPAVEVDRGLAVACGLCKWIGWETQLARTLAETPDLLQRIEPGGTVPAGECPKCGGLCYPADP